MNTTPENIDNERELSRSGMELVRVMSQMPQAAIVALQSHLRLLEKKYMLAAASASSDVEMRRAQGAFLVLSTLSETFKADKAVKARPKAAVQMHRSPMM